MSDGNYPGNILYVGNNFFELNTLKFVSRRSYTKISEESVCCWVFDFFERFTLAWDYGYIIILCVIFNNWNTISLNLILWYIVYICKKKLQQLLYNKSVHTWIAYSYWFYNMSYICILFKSFTNPIIRLINGILLSRLIISCSLNTSSIIFMIEILLNAQLVSDVSEPCTKILRRYFYVLLFGFFDISRGVLQF